MTPFKHCSDDQDHDSVDKLSTQETKKVAEVLECVSMPALNGDYRIDRPVERCTSQQQVNCDADHEGYH